MTGPLLYAIEEPARLTCPIIIVTLVCPADTPEFDPQSLILWVVGASFPIPKIGFVARPYLQSYP